MTRDRSLYAAVSALVCAFLLMRYGHFIELSGDFVQHFTLVNEIMTHGYRRPDAPLATMGTYPDGAHWMAAVLGWIVGSGLVAIVLITIAAAYGCYLLLLELVGKDSPIKIALAALAFVALAGTHSLIGWEISVNYFWPQLVNNLALLGALLALARMQGAWTQAGLVFAVGTLAMFVHALASLQLFACGLTWLSFAAFSAWREQKRFPVRIVAACAALLVGAGANLLFHPAFRAIVKAAENNGYLEFGYSHVLPVVVLCGLIGVAALLRARERIAMILGCAGIATAALAFLQYLALRLGHAGSDYAVKKHMFMLVTLAAVNVVRIIGDWKSAKWSFGWLAAPLLAGIGAFHVLAGLNAPVVPVLRALDYARHAAQFDLPGFVPGNAVAADSTQPPMINFMISATAFAHPVDLKAYQWLSGADPTTDATYAMVRRTPEIDAKCGRKFGEAADYVVVEAACLK